MSLQARRPSLNTVGASVVSVALEAELEECQRQIRSGRVSILESSGGGPSSSASPDRSFVDSFDAEFDRTSDAIKAAEHSIESTARAILLNADVLARKDDCDIASINDLRLKAKELSDRVLNISAQTVNNAREFRRIAQLADRRLGTTLVATTERRLESDPWTGELSGGGLVVVLLSDLYSVIRDIEAKKKKKSAGGPSQDATWVAPSSFERVTTKYWVKDQSLSQVVLASITELPLLVYGRKGGRILDRKDAAAQSKSQQSDTSLWTSLASPISSVYFDSPDMRMYSERIKRSEGAQLFRIRWYGKKPKGDDVIFLELKTHHEKWIGDKSVKERCGIRERDVPVLMGVSTGKWNTKQASDMVRAANPKESEESILELTKLLLQIRELVCKFHLTPCVRTKYTRVALQSASNNNLRLTIDRDITMINERARGRSSKSWCLEDDETIRQDAIVKMPYCVFEVKVAGADGSPPFVTELEESRAIVEAKKFSKFLSGASIFNAGKIKTLPWWASDEAFVPIFEKIQSRSSSQPRNRLSPTQTTRENPANNPIGHSFQVQTNNAPSLDLTSSTTSTLDATNRSAEKRPNKRRKSSMRRFSIPLGWKEEQISPLDKPVASKAPARVEPKSYFANERTFIQWISAALLFVTISQLLYILASQTNTPEASIAGSFMIGMSLFISVYGVCIYYRRIYLMKNGKPYGYADFVGPGVLTASIVAGIVLLIVFSHKALNKPAPAAVTMHHQPGQCIRRGMEGVSIMEMQPSGVVIDGAKGLALIPSLGRIVALPSGLPTDQENEGLIQVVAKIPGANLEALEYVEDRLFALSEDTEGSEIIALEWVDEHYGSRHLTEVQRWKIGLQGAEAMTLVPSEESGKLNLVVAGDLMSSISPTTRALAADKGRLSIDMYDVDSFDLDSEKVKPSSKMNKSIVAKGLRDEKVGSMQYFEGLLYMLFDNDRVIRAFDTRTGQIVQETRLPIAEEGSELEWEGMRLERVGENKVFSNLRGSGKGVLVLHLALDTPGQVWSLRLNEAGQGWTLPSCAI